ncbi:MAG TPA: hypothetical protein VLJ44_05980 [Gaiellaceae bacterium]|nr:hypothetical protein [Gaiellaceae bacterium]
MSRIALAIALSVACCIAGTISLPAHATATNSPPCTPKITKIHGQQAGVNCGPATAILRVGGKTYTFRHGFCQKSKMAGTALELTLGTTVLGDDKRNAGQPSFDITVAKTHAASIGFAYYGGRDLLKNDLQLIEVKGNIPSKGTFSSWATATVKFSGSWNCHGLVWQGP